MREFVKNKEHCRRLDIANFFGVNAKRMAVLHSCCDICAQQCSCGFCPVKVYQNVDIDWLNTKQNELSMNVSLEQRGTFISVLNDIKKEHSKSASVLGSAFLQNVLDESTINELGNNLQHLFTVQDVMENFPILENQVALEILTVVNIEL